MRKAYTINEETARVAQEINSFRDYEKGSATAQYNKVIDGVYYVVEKIEKEKPELAEKAAYMADRFAKKYADYLNAYYRNEASCPSVMICGPANFPVKKKERQNSRRQTLNDEYTRLMEYKDKIVGLLTDTRPILSGDADAIERLQDKINDLEQTKALMIKINAYFRKHKTMEGFEEDIPDDIQRHIDFMVSHGFTDTGVFSTSNTNAEINRLKDRLYNLVKVKESGTTETAATDADGNELFQVVENVEIMRLQLIFDGKPNDTVRDILKSNGFKWSPKNEAWQRQLTDNAKRAYKRIEKDIIAAL